MPMTTDGYGAPVNAVTLWEWQGAALPVAVAPAPRRVWLPNEITFDTVGSHGGWSAYRYISASNAAITSEFYPWEGCQDLAVWVLAAKTAAGVLTLKVELLGSMVAGQDAANHALALGPTGAGLDTLSTSATVPVSMLISTANMTTASNVSYRNISPLFWGLKVTPSAANLPFTIWVVGR